MVVSLTFMFTPGEIIQFVSDIFLKLGLGLQSYLLHLGFVVLVIFVRIIEITIKPPPFGRRFVGSLFQKQHFQVAFFQGES